MRVFVTGATGLIGRTLIPALIAEGHTVLGLARTPEKLLAVAQIGATPLRGDVLDAQTMSRAIADARPDAIVNLATRIPLKLRVSLDDWKENDRVRLEGTRNLLAAVKAAIKPDAGLRLFVQESFDQVCAPQGDQWIDENAPLNRHPFLHATEQMETLVRSSNLPTTLLRLSVLNSANSWHTQQSLMALRRGLLPIIGDGNAFVSMVHIQDAVQAILRTLQQPETAAGETFNVVDNEPVRMRDLFPYAAKLLNGPPPRTVPPMMAKLVVGSLTIDVLTQSHRMTNAHIRQCLGFEPQYPTFRETWAQVLQEIGNREFATSEDLK